MDDVSFCCGHLGCTGLRVCFRVCALVGGKLLTALGLPRTSQARGDDFRKIYCTLATPTPPAINRSTQPGRILELIVDVAFYPAPSRPTGPSNPFSFSSNSRCDSRQERADWTEAIERGTGVSWLNCPPREEVREEGM